ncbi:hypothetical protein GCM10018780_41650 [Streptomyces lanatus]|nr:hypothetical protein GCM10018780_41650 [Streptomyces lanatus]
MLRDFGIGSANYRFDKGRQAKTHITAAPHSAASCQVRSHYPASAQEEAEASDAEGALGSASRGAYRYGGHQTVAEHRADSYDASSSAPAAPARIPRSPGGTHTAHVRTGTPANS